MRTAAIDEACGRFEAWLGPRLGAPLEDTRVTFDEAGRSVTCRARTPEGPVDLRVSGAEWRVTGPASVRDRWSERLRALETSEPLATLEAAVGPRSPRREPLTGALARALLGRDGALLADTVDAFRRCYGEALEAVWLEGDDAPSVGYPAVVTDQEVLMYAPPPFRRDAHTIAYLEDLGFAVDARHRVFAVPTPRAFARRRARLGIRGGLRPELQTLRATLYSPRGWLTQITRGVFPMNVHGRVAHTLARLGHALPLHRSQRQKRNNHLHALGHDMGMHTLALHRVPATRMAELRRLGRVALARGRAGAAASFFEERLTRACVETWAVTPAPTEFEARFDAVFPALRAELARLAHG